MRRSRALHHLDDLVAAAGRLAAPGSIVSLPVRSLWVSGALADGAAELEVVQVAVALDMPADDLPLHLEPAGAQHWANAAGVATKPVTLLWRSTRAPLRTAGLERPLQVWDSATGRVDAALDALAEGAADVLREVEPPAEQLLAGLEADRDVSCARCGGPPPRTPSAGGRRAASTASPTRCGRCRAATSSCSTPSKEFAHSAKGTGRNARRAG
ncbi:hypothetical protein CLV35_1611 [Motilibacter peucedani]|uniref:DUF7711 domain-containing protein n=1 Tax=Motilibacter peucedani TaxID=598650 RepID=A0A420XSP8_9ACTN|nr:hypothetical protein [Motilibacter peucedani]RKS77908.1 hypothetical protein CLV35_1611 [Motilibacter peucedani]